MSNQKPRSGRPKNSKNIKTIRKLAVDNLKKIAMDEDSPLLARTVACAMLLSEIEP